MVFYYNCKDEVIFSSVFAKKEKNKTIVFNLTCCCSGGGGSGNTRCFKKNHISQIR